MNIKFMSKIVLALAMFSSLAIASEMGHGGDTKNMHMDKNQNQNHMMDNNINN